MLLHSDERIRGREVEKLRAHYARYKKLYGFAAEWAQRICRRSIFQKLSVMQIVFCLQLDNYTITPRIL